MKTLKDKALIQRDLLINEYVKAPQSQKRGLFQKIKQLCEAISAYINARK